MIILLFFSSTDAEIDCLIPFILVIDDSNWDENLLQKFFFFFSVLCVTFPDELMLELIR